MKSLAWLTFGVLFLAALGARAAETAKETASFGTLKAASPEAVRGQAEEWLKSTGKTDAATQKAFRTIWEAADRPVLDRLADTFALDAGAAKILAEARDPAAPAPKAVPSLIKDLKLNAFFRANLALIYGRALSNRRIFDDALEAFKSVKPEQVVDPAAYFFHRAVAERALLQKKEAIRTIGRLLDDVPDAPERYKMVAALMFFDLQGWKEKDLGEISRKMDRIVDRLEVARGGPQTQQIQKEVVFRLDELIKRMENQAKSQQQQQPGEGKEPGCPPGAQPQPGEGQQDGNQQGNQNQNNNQPANPMQDSNIATNSGPGDLDQKKLKELIDVWGKLPDGERAKAMAAMSKDLPPNYKQIIEDYFKRSSQTEAKDK